MVTTLGSYPVAAQPPPLAQADSYDVVRSKSIALRD